MSTFQQNISKFVTGNISYPALPSVAIEALKQGLDTPSLRILAGLSNNENEFVINQYFNNTLKELSIELPGKRQAAINIGIALAEEIVAGKQPVFEGVQHIIRKAIHAHPFYEETINYCYDSIGFEKAYGLFYTIDDLRNAGNIQWDPNKTNQSLENELTKDLVNELQVWINNIQTSKNS